jgi:hypothetical protein
MRSRARRGGGAGSGKKPGQVVENRRTEVSATPPAAKTNAGQVVSDRHRNGEWSMVKIGKLRLRMIMIWRVSVKIIATR